MTKSRPVIIFMSVLAGLQFLFAGMTATNLGEFANQTILAIGAYGMLATAACQIGVQFYLQQLVTPVQDVVAYRDRNGSIVPGELANDPGRAQEAVDVLTTPAADDVGRL